MKRTFFFAGIIKNSSYVTQAFREVFKSRNSPLSISSSLKIDFNSFAVYNSVTIPVTGLLAPEVFSNIDVVSIRAATTMYLKSLTGSVSFLFGPFTSGYRAAHTLLSPKGSQNVMGFRFVTMFDRLEI